MAAPWGSASVSAVKTRVQHPGLPAETGSAGDRSAVPSMNRTSAISLDRNKATAWREYQCINAANRAADRVARPQYKTCSCRCQRLFRSVPVLPVFRRGPPVTGPGSLFSEHRRENEKILEPDLFVTVQVEPPVKARGITGSAEGPGE